MNFLERHGKKIALALCFATCVPVISTVYAYEAQPGWHGEGADRYYVLESTREQAVGWLHLDDGTYYFDDNGEWCSAGRRSTASVTISERMDEWQAANRRSTMLHIAFRKMAGC